MTANNPRRQDPSRDKGQNRKSVSDKVGHEQIRSLRAELRTTLSVCCAERDTLYNRSPHQWVNRRSFQPSIGLQKWDLENECRVLLVDTTRSKVNWRVCVWRTSSTNVTCQRRVERTLDGASPSHRFAHHTKIQSGMANRAPTPPGNLAHSSATREHCGALRNQCRLRCAQEPGCIRPRERRRLLGASQPAETKLKH